MSSTHAQLALLGGPQAVTLDPGDMFTWPIVTEEDERAVIEVIRARSMSGADVTRSFEREAAAFFGTRHALAFCNGTASILGGMYACGVRRGDEVIGPPLPYWATVMPAYSLGASVVFADILPDTFCIDPADVERRITPRTRAVIVTHAYGHPCEMDAIVRVAHARGVKVIEDVSHAHGGLYRGRMLGTIGDVGCMSVMSGKSLAIGEGGLLVTDDRQIHERALAFGFYGRARGSTWGSGEAEVTSPELTRFSGVPLGGVKHRLNQTAAAMGRVQLRHYPQRMAEIQRAMNHFWDLLEGVRGVRAHRVAPDSSSTMGGWYCPVGRYLGEELGDLPLDRFVAAVAAEGCPVGPPFNFPLHLHPFFHEADVYGDGRPTSCAFADRDVRQGPGSLPVAEEFGRRAFQIPWFKHYRPDVIARFAAAVRKVCDNAGSLLEDDAPATSVAD